MSFWNDYLKRVAHDSFSKYDIVLNGNITHELSYARWKAAGIPLPSKANRISQGPIILSTVIDNDQVHILDYNTAVKENLSRIITNNRVYFLPWKMHGMTHVTFDDLNRSNCNYFMTSQFSGCRFVVTNEYIAHIAHWSDAQAQYFANNLQDRSAIRTLTELQFRYRNYPDKPKLYRSISTSRLNQSNVNAFGSDNVIHSSYYQCRGVGDDQMLLFGYKDSLSPLGWTFKYMKFQARTPKAPKKWYRVQL